MNAAMAVPSSELTHAVLDSGVEFAVDRLPHRNTVAMCFRMLTGLVHEPPEHTGVTSIVARLISKGTENYSGRQLADAFDAIGARRGVSSGRQSTLVRVLCLPEFVDQVVDLVGEQLRRPTFPEDACGVAVELARQDLRHMEDEPKDVLRVKIQRMTLGPQLGRHTGGEFETLERLTPDVVREHWRANYRAGRLQVTAAGPVDPDQLAAALTRVFTGFGAADADGREPAAFEFTPQRDHQDKDLQQEYLAITLPGLPKDDPRFAVERVLLGVLSGGMSGRLFTEVREKQGLVYWVGAWHEQPRGKGVIHLGASTRPERASRTYDTLLRELGRLAEDLTEEEVNRARNGLVAQAETEDDLTRARASGLADDLFHFSQPVGFAKKLDAVRAVTFDQVVDYAKTLPRDRLCVATLGPRPL